MSLGEIMNSNVPGRSRKPAVLYVYVSVASLISRWSFLFMLPATGVQLCK